MNDIEKVKELGEKIGYGHLMSLASALWRESLEKQGIPKIGAFVPTCLIFIEKEYREMTEESEKIYDEIIKENKNEN